MIKQECNRCGLEVFTPEEFKENDCPQTYTCEGELQPCK